MGRKKKRHSNKNDGNKSKSSDASTSITLEDEKDGKKVAPNSQIPTKTIEESKEIVDQANDILMEMQKFKDNKKGKNEPGCSAENLQVAMESPENVTKGKKDHYTKESIEEVLDFMSNLEKLTVTQEIKDCMQKVKDKNLPLTKYLTFGNLKNGSKVMTQKNSKLDELDAESEIVENRDFCSSTNELEVPESHEKTRVTTDLSLEIEDYDETIELGKNDAIHFEFDADGNARFKVKEKYCAWHGSFIEKIKSVDFEFKDENIQVYFVGNEIFVSTPSSEFSFCVRDTNQVTLADRATQT